MAKVGGEKADRRKLNIEHVAGDVFKFVETMSDTSVLWGELWRENERQLMKKEMQTQLIRILINDCFQVVHRTIWQPEMKMVPSWAKRRGSVALFLHNLERPACSSWQWMKMARPLYRRGFSIVSIDFPGFGGSTMNSNSNVDPSRWFRKRSHKIVFEGMNELSIERFCMLAEGSACDNVIELLATELHRLDRRHIFHNPILDLDRLFPSSQTRPAKGQGYEEWQRLVREGQLLSFANVIREANVCLLVTYDEQVACPRTQETMRFIDDLVERNLASITVEPVSKTDLCEAQVGSTVNARILVPSRWMQERYTDFICGGPPEGEQAEPISPPVQSDSGWSLPGTKSPPRSRPVSKLPAASGATPTMAATWSGSSPWSRPRPEELRLGSNTLGGTPSPSTLATRGGDFSVGPSKEFAGALEDRQQSRSQLALPPSAVSRSQSVGTTHSAAARPGTGGSWSATGTPERRSRSLAGSSFGGEAAATAPGGFGAAADSARQARPHSIRQLSKSQRHLDGPYMFRFKMLSKVPKAMQPPPQEQEEEVFVERPPDFTDDEFRDLKDGVAASIRAMGPRGSAAMSATGSLGRPMSQEQEAQKEKGRQLAELQKSKGVESRRQLWKVVNVDMRRTMTTIQTMKSQTRRTRTFALPP